MSKSLIITEKPSVAREFARILHVSGSHDGYLENDSYVITWCIGHLVGLVYPEEYDEKYKKWRLLDLPFLPKEYKYGVLPKVGGQYKVVTGMLHRADIDTVYWAGDAGKEGQTIEENIRKYGGVRDGMRELRVWIDSQTEEEILRGLREAKPMSEYDRLAASGVMRTIEDYAMGINFSRAMSVKYGRMLNDAAGTKKYTAISVGRVMTCVLGMVVYREREIRDFKETPFYRVVGKFAVGGDVAKEATKLGNATGDEDASAESQSSGGKSSFTAEWKAVESSRYFDSPLLYKENGFKKRENAGSLINLLEGANFDGTAVTGVGAVHGSDARAENVENRGGESMAGAAIVDSIERGKQKKKPPLLFNLAELQAECAKRFKISPDETLSIAQELYEKKLTTYPRTDARVLSKAIAKEIGKNIGGLKSYAPVAEYASHILQTGSHKNIARTQYVDDSKITDHYAIIPTGQTGIVSSLRGLDRSVYDMIARRFLGIFYPTAEYETLKLVVDVGGEKFFATAKGLKMPGYLEVEGMPKSGSGASTRDKDRDEDASNAKNLQERGDVESLVKEKLAESGDEGEGNEALLLLSKHLKKGAKLSACCYEIREGKTSPPKRYTSGSMVLAMENAGQLIEDEELRAQIKGSGIGTSATRAEIIAKLVRIGYLNLNKKTQILRPERLGEMVFEVVSLTIPALLNPKMTASWEKGLEGITSGTVQAEEYRAKLEDFVRRKTNEVIGRDLRGEISRRITAIAGADGDGRSGKAHGSGGKGVSRKTANVSESTDGVTRQVENVGNGTGAVSRRDASEISNIACPKCGKPLIKTRWQYECECGFHISHTVARLLLGDDTVRELIDKGRTTAKVSGFTSKAGKKFDAWLTFAEDEGIKFSFNEP